SHLGGTGRGVAIAEDNHDVLDICRVIGAEILLRRYDTARIERSLAARSLNTAVIGPGANRLNEGGAEVQRSSVRSTIAVLKPDEQVFRVVVVLCNRRGCRRAGVVLRGIGRVGRRIGQRRSSGAVEGS